MFSQKTRPGSHHPIEVFSFVYVKQDSYYLDGIENATDQGEKDQPGTKYVKILTVSQTEVQFDFAKEFYFKQTYQQL